MGLSDEERISKIYNGVRSLIEVVADVDVGRYEIAWTDDLEALKAHVGRLWHAFLGGRSNGAYWILGGDADNGVTSESRGPWAVAVRAHLEDSRRKVEARA